MNEVKAVVLAAGKGTRMQSEQCNLPKVLREACGKPLLHYVLSALDFIPRENTILVVGYQREKVMDAFPGYPTAVQEPQMGTGHAVLCARPFLDGFDGTVLVCYGDMPLLRREVYEGLLNCLWPHPARWCGRVCPGRRGQGLHAGTEADPRAQCGHLLL